MRSTLWTPTLAWLAAVTGACLLALATPSESGMMGRLPFPVSQRLGVPGQMPTGRVLAFVGFERSQRAEINSWIRGLRLCQEALPWIKFPVLNDPGDEQGRAAVERRVLASHGPMQSTRVVPVFTDRDQFIRQAGLSGREHASVLVVDRDGQVLAKAEGQFDPARATALRETLLAPDALAPPPTPPAAR